ncbi:MAG: SpoIID/LytB domain-containing protein [Deltaproteobacteria bacterium]|nr:SpoIID/LytB domain-containing protein [Deltaproteobacteria bacterium]
MKFLAHSHPDEPLQLVGEPQVAVGISEKARAVTGRLQGTFVVAGKTISGDFSAEIIEGGNVLLRNPRITIRAPRIELENHQGGIFALDDVIIGKDFHWERREKQEFRGSLVLQATTEGISVINEIGLEEYLSVVIASEMSAAAPVEFLKAQAIVARSWSLARLLSEEKDEYRQEIPPTEVVCWYGRGRHNDFDFCADDHCQRYHGITRETATHNLAATRQTRGLFLVSGTQVCDARYHKACGGLTEHFSVAWEDNGAPYLVPIVDSLAKQPFITTEESAHAWLCNSPNAYCRVYDEKLLATILPSFDRETADFFRWQVTYRREELEAIIQEKAKRHLGELKEIIALQRGASGRIYRLRLVGSREEMTIGKELEIRRVLAINHLYSSAFVVEKRGGGVFPDEIVLHGGGWGHGVGPCQIGAANMALQGFSCEQILGHYFPQTNLEQLY